MHKLVMASLLLCAAAVIGAQVQAQAPAAPPAAGGTADGMPFDIPYGAPIGLEAAQKLIAAVEAEAAKHRWKMNIAVVDTHGDLVAFARMDGAQIASVAVAQHKARAAASFRRPTKVFEDAIQKSDNKYVLTLDGVIGSRGGIPLIEDGKLIGAIGCSGGTGSQDEVACTAGAATVNK